LNKVTIIDAGIGNLPSLVSAFNRLDLECEVVSNPEDFKMTMLTVFPGVGHWSRATSRLLESGWSEAIQEYVQRGGNLFGICLGMQLLGRTSEEAEGLGLGLLPMSTELNKSHGSRVENLGWNRVQAPEWSSHDWLGVENGRAFYFTHKYSVSTLNPQQSTLLSTDFPGVVAAVQLNNVIGVQFHPERSGKSGLDLLAKVVEWAEA
jgi:glutamine amidotransferase